jgi:hypothetical protein
MNRAGIDQAEMIPLISGSGAGQETGANGQQSNAIGAVSKTRLGIETGEWTESELIDLGGSG